MIYTNNKNQICRIEEATSPGSVTTMEWRHPGRWSVVAINIQPEQCFSSQRILQAIFYNSFMSVKNPRWSVDVKFHYFVFTLLHEFGRLSVLLAYIFTIYPHGKNSLIFFKNVAIAIKHVLRTHVRNT